MLGGFFTKCKTTFVGEKGVSCIVSSDIKNRAGVCFVSIVRAQNAFCLLIVYPSCDDGDDRDDQK